MCLNILYILVIPISTKKNQVIFRNKEELQDYYTHFYKQLSQIENIHVEIYVFSHRKHRFVLDYVSNIKEIIEKK